MSDWLPRLVAGVSLTLACGGAPVQSEMNSEQRKGPRSQMTVSPQASLPEVTLDALGRSGPSEFDGRSPFHLEDRRTDRVPRPRRIPPSPLPRTGRGPARVSAGAPIGDTVTLRLIGLLDGGQVGRVAILSNNDGVHHGRENQIVIGRYRIARVGAASVDLDLLDGGRRLTLDLHDW